MNAGSWRIETVEAERFRLDGGSMFGVVPRPLWERRHPADAKNRIQMVTRCLIARGEGRVVIVDTGMGDDWSDREREIYDIDDANGSIAAACAARGIAPDDVTDVVLTHLHFDHGGGSTRADGAAVFPGARYHVQRRQLDWARAPSTKDRGSYREADFMPLWKEGRLELVDGPAELAEGIEVLPVDGHTPAMQLVKVTDGTTTVLYMADLVPTRAHLRTPWVMAYDNEPLKTVQEKARWVGKAAEEGWVLFLEHDAATAALRVRAGEKDFEALEDVEI